MFVRTYHNAADRLEQCFSYCFSLLSYFGFCHCLFTRLPVAGVPMFLVLTGISRWPVSSLEIFSAFGVNQGQAEAIRSLLK